MKKNLQVSLRSLLVVALGCACGLAMALDDKASKPDTAGTPSAEDLCRKVEPQERAACTEGLSQIQKDLDEVDQTVWPVFAACLSKHEKPTKEVSLACVRANPAMMQALDKRSKSPKAGAPTPAEVPAPAQLCAEVEDDKQKACTDALTAAKQTMDELDESLWPELAQCLDSKDLKKEDDAKACFTADFQARLEAAVKKKAQAEMPADGAPKPASAEVPSPTQLCAEVEDDKREKCVEDMGEVKTLLDEMDETLWPELAQCLDSADMNSKEEAAKCMTDGVFSKKLEAAAKAAAMKKAGK